jgi:hypothetical protein
MGKSILTGLLATDSLPISHFCASVSSEGSLDCQYKKLMRPESALELKKEFNGLDAQWGDDANLFVASLSDVVLIWCVPSLLRSVVSFAISF